MQTEDMYNKLNHQQRAAVLSSAGPVLVIAGAGSGKTRVIACRVMYLVEQGCDPSSILAVTFTNKAAHEMKERIGSLVANFSNSQPMVCTFHGLGLRILKESCLLLGYEKGLAICDEEESNKTLRDCLKFLNLKTDTISLYKNVISSLKNRMCSPTDMLKDLEGDMKSNFVSVYNLYQQRLKESNAVDFDDLLFLTVQLFQEYPEALEMYNKRWKHILIDEYQDTNHTQYTLAKLLSKGSLGLFAVGDPDQSIYSWRGANLKNILNFERDFPGANIINLEFNYRSTSNILSVANSLIANNKARYDKILRSVKEEGEKIQIYLGASEREEADFVVGEIEYLHEKKDIAFKDITIMYRTNFQSRAFEDLLLRRKIPYRILGGVSFYQRREIKDVLAFLKVILRDKDWISFERSLVALKVGFGPATIEALRAYVASSELSMIPACEECLSQLAIKMNKKQKEGLQNYLELIKKLKEKSLTVPVHELVMETIKETGYQQILKDDKETYEDRNANINELVAKTIDWEDSQDEMDLESFLEELSLKGSVDSYSDTDDMITLMTLHNGKGLEFIVAFIVGMEEDLFPHANSRGSVDSLEEERRLCYVGYTRAKELLYLTATSSRFIWGGFRTMRPSRFFKEIPPEYIKRLRR